MQKIGIIHNFTNGATKELAHALMDKLASDYSCWVLPTSEVAQALEVASGTDVIVSVGGDGTMLRVARAAVPQGIPILGVNMGRVGFMTEIQGSEALEKVPEYLQAECRIEERSMLEIEIIPEGQGRGAAGHYLALNDVLVARGALPRVCQIEARVDGAVVTEYRSDGVILATATGSTSYALASGGPVMYPESKDMILVPVSAHLSFSSPLVIGPESVVELCLLSENQGVVSVDGQIDHPLHRGDMVRARRSDEVMRFLRAAPASAFYATLTQRLRPREQG